MDLALNNLQWLICHKTIPYQTKPNQTKSISISFLICPVTLFGCEGATHVVGLG